MTTTKSIKDYLHFYLGARVTIKNVSAYLIGQGLEDGRYLLSADILHFILTDQCILETIVLRNLSDMTDEEANELYILNGGGDKTPLTTWLLDKYCMAIGRQPLFTVPAVTYLLSKQFDLFGLCEQGLAIDKQTLI